MQQTNQYQQISWAKSRRPHSHTNITANEPTTARTISHPVPEYPQFLEGIDVPRTFLLIVALLIPVLPLWNLRRRFERRHARAATSRYDQIRGPEHRDLLNQQRVELLRWIDGIEDELKNYCAKPNEIGTNPWILTAKTCGLDYWIADSMKKINHARNRVVHDGVPLSLGEWKILSRHWAKLKRYFNIDSGL